MRAMCPLTGYECDERCAWLVGGACAVAVLAASAGGGLTPPPARGNEREKEPMEWNWEPGIYGEVRRDG